MPTHPELRAMRRAMRDEARNPKGRVIEVAHAYEIMHGARTFRANLLTAGIDRDELQKGSAPSIV